MDISVVIPTRNRPKSLKRLLLSLDQQKHHLKEVIIVDASDEKLDVKQLKNQFKNLRLHYIPSEPSVCIQKNLGIKQAGSSHIFLCDDDMETPQDYVETLMEYLHHHPDAGAVTGLVMEPDNGGEFRSQFPSSSFKRLLWNFIFQLTVWADLDKTQTNFFNRIPFYFIKKFYSMRENSYTLAGWPLISKFETPVFRATIYGLGASIVRKDWLTNSPFDEILDPSGIGDNYGVAIQFPQPRSINVLTGVYVIHHKEVVNRLPQHLAYFRRILALDYFLSKNKQFSFLNKMFLTWSLFGNLISFFMRGEKAMITANIKLLGRIVSGKNPYILASRQSGMKIVSPQLN